MKKLLAILILTIFVTSPAWAVIRQGGTGPIAEAEHNVVYIMDGKTSTGTGVTVTVSPLARTFDASVTGTGAVTATVIIQVCNHGCDDDLGWIDSTTSPHIALSGTTTASDGFRMDAKWAYVRAKVTAISGTGAAVTVTMGI
jgi:hypothetical protein